MNMQNKEYVIVLAMDGGSVYKIVPLLKSIKTNTINSKLYLLTDEPPIDIYCVYFDDIKTYSLDNITYNKGHISKHMFLRYFINEAWPDLDKCVYLDYDTIVLQDFAEILDGDDWIFKAVKADTVNYNSGVIAFNFKHKMCNVLLEICKKEFLNNNRPDEEIFNSVCAEYVTEIHKGYNAPGVFRFKRGKYDYCCDDLNDEDLKIIHYLSKNKPMNHYKRWKYYYDYYERKEC